MLAPVPQSTVTLATCRCFVVLSHSPKAYRSLQSTYVLRKDPCRTRCGNRSPPARKESPCHFTIPQQQAIEATSGRSEEQSPDRKAASAAHSPVRASPATNSKIALQGTRANATPWPPVYDSGNPDGSEPPCFCCSRCGFREGSRESESSRGRAGTQDAIGVRSLGGAKLGRIIGRPHPRFTATANLA